MLTMTPFLVCRARIELRDTTIRIKDGLSGTALVDDDMEDLEAEDTTMSVKSVALNTDDNTLVPIGARFTLPSQDTVYTVTGRTPPAAGPTTEITFAPGLEAVPADEAVITFLPQRVEIKIGEGNLTYTENKEYEYLTDRDELDTVREAAEQPMDVNLDFVYEFVTTGTNEKLSPVDALKRKGAASEWVSTSLDPCEPYAVDIEVEHAPRCGGAAIEDEITLFPDFRRDSLEFDLREATISVTGRCNASEPVVTRA
jgi:hypothetical protein